MVRKERFDPKEWEAQEDKQLEDQQTWLTELVEKTDLISSGKLLGLKTDALKTATEIMERSGIKDSDLAFTLDDRDWEMVDFFLQWNVAEDLAKQRNSSLDPKDIAGLFSDEYALLVEDLYNEENANAARPLFAYLNDIAVLTQKRYGNLEEPSVFSKVPQDNSFLEDVQRLGDEFMSMRRQGLFFPKQPSQVNNGIILTHNNL